MAGRSKSGIAKASMGLPLELRNVCREMKIEWSNHLARNGFTRVLRKRVILCQDCAPLRATISMMQLNTTLLGDPNFLIVSEGSSPRGEGPSGSAKANVHKTGQAHCARTRRSAACY